MNNLDPVWRDRIWIAGAALVAVVVGAQVAQGGLLFPALVLVTTGILILYQLNSERLGKVVLLGLVAGYLIGNRGFAQFNPIPSVPLLPGEAGLGLLLFLIFIERSKRSDDAFSFTWMDGLILSWIAFGAGRMVIDARAYGFVAVRDFATVYYAAYYFIAKAMTIQDQSIGRSVLAVIRISTVPMGVLFLFFEAFPDFFIQHLSIGGIPLIFYKADLVGLYASIGAVLHFVRFEEEGRPLNLVLCLLLVGLVISTNNRASLVALGVMVACITLAGRWRLGAWLGVAGALASVAIVASAYLSNESWQDTVLIELYEAAVSITDPTGTGNYLGEGTSSKGDNNLFRWVWWDLVMRETWAEAPLTGMGFGYDLALKFEQAYLLSDPTDFTVRSPHSILITVFGRMGLVGLSLFLGFITLMLKATWRATRSDNLPLLVMWGGASAIFLSACFGVVLEGPMGAIPFWILLGLANGMNTAMRPVSFPAVTKSNPSPGPA